MGDLVPSDEPNVMWIVDADLLQFENGNAFNQTYATPNNTEYQEQIHLKFTQKNHALFSVNYIGHTLLWQISYKHLGNLWH